MTQLLIPALIYTFFSLTAIAGPPSITAYSGPRQNPQPTPITLPSTTPDFVFYHGRMDWSCKNPPTTSATNCETTGARVYQSAGCVDVSINCEFERHLFEANVFNCTVRSPNCRNIGLRAADEPPTGCGPGYSLRREIGREGDWRFPFVYVYVCVRDANTGTAPPNPRPATAAGAR